jgi:hypothetical protein
MILARVEKAWVKVGKRIEDPDSTFAIGSPQVGSKI